MTDLDYGWQAETKRMVDRGFKNFFAKRNMKPPPICKFEFQFTMPELDRFMNGGTGHETAFYSLISECNGVAIPRSMKDNKL